MGLFGRKEREPIDHPGVDRSILVEAPLATIEGHVTEYGTLMGRGARSLDARVSTSGAWVRIDLRPEVCTPGSCTTWRTGSPTSATSSPSRGAGPDHAAYHLVWVDDALDILEGWTADGRGITVSVPDNRIIRPDLEVSGTLMSTAERLTAAGVPSEGWSDRNVLPIVSEDPGHHQNPRLEANCKDRRALRASSAHTF